MERGKILDFESGGFMKFEVKKYYTSFVTFKIEANSEEDAYKKAEQLKIDIIELQNNLQDWKEADEITKLEENN